MGITIKSKRHSCDMGYAGFHKFRKKVAEMVSQEFFEHYINLENNMFLFGEKRKKFFKEHYEKTNEFMEQDKLPIEVYNFCYQSDCEGYIHKSEAKFIYQLIKDCDDEIIYGYTGRENCAKMKDLKQIFKDCTSNCQRIDWR